LGLCVRIGLSRMWSDSKSEFSRRNSSRVSIGPGLREWLLGLGALAVVALSSPARSEEAGGFVQTRLHVHLFRILAGAEAANRRRVLAAITDLEASVRRHPTALAYRQLGELYEELGDEEQAIARFRKSLALDPKAALSHHRLGRALAQTGDLDGAITEYEHTLALDPGFLAALGDLGDVAREKGDWNKALTCYRAIVSMHPRSALAHAELGYTLVRADQLSRALPELRQAIALGPRLGRAHFLLAEALMRAGKNADAVAQYAEAVRLEPESTSYRLQYGMALTRTDPTAASAQLRETVKRNPGDYVARRALGMALRRAGDAAGAEAELRRARELNAAADRRAEAEVRTNKAIKLLHQGDVTRAIASLRDAIEVDPDLRAAREYLGIAYSVAGDWGAANQAFTEALRGGASDPEIHFNFGIALEHQADWNGAAREFAAALELRPAHPQAHCSLARALQRLGDAHGAKRELQLARQFGTCAAGEQP
jgi:tetratricopeptide (TPR) repeat protein